MPRSHRESAPKTPDDHLAFHLKEAEDHLIRAVELFGRASKPKRGEIYEKRLRNAQEAVTTLYRHELIRIRGPQKEPRRRKAA